MKRNILTFIALLFSVVLFGQNITGKVTDKENQAIEFANVALYSLPDSTLITGTITNKDGDFSISPNGNGTKKAFLKISFIGYETQIVPAISGQTIVLNDDSQFLEGAKIKANLPLIEMKNDALVASVQNSVLSEAGTGNDVLKRLPLITGKDGKYEVFGKGSAKIFINNREMRDESELDNLSSKDIKSVEIVTNPGARYDASVKAVIRIYTVPKVGDGFSFDVRSSYMQWKTSDYTGQLNVNYRKKGWDVFGTFKYDHEEWIQESTMWQKTYVDTLWRQDNTIYSKSFDNNLMGIAGINYEINPKHYVGMKYTISGSPKTTSSSTMTSTVLADGKFYDKWSSTGSSTDYTQPSHRVNVYYNGTVGKLNIDFNTDFYTAKSSSISETTEKSQEFDDRQVDSENQLNNNLFASKLVLSYPLGPGQLVVGSEYTNTYRDDKYILKDNIGVQDILSSSKTTNKEQNIAAFAEYSLGTPIGQLGAGLRYEYVKSDYFVNDVKNTEQSRTYHQVFPNVSFATMIKGVALQLSYTAKTHRPSYYQLSSNMSYANRFLIQTGNPFLKPTTTHDVSLMGSWKFIQLMAGYSHQQNAIINWIEQDEDKPALSILSFKSIPKLPSLYVFASISPTIKIWTPQLSAGFLKQWLTITSSGKPIKLNMPIPMVSLNNSFQLPKGFIITLDAMYLGKGDFQNIHLAQNSVMVNASISKSFLADRLNIALRGHDIFNQYRNSNLLYNDKMELFQQNKFNTRKIELTIRYRFNTAKSKYKGTGAGQSELDRFQKSESTDTNPLK